MTASTGRHREPRKLQRAAVDFWFAVQRMTRRHEEPPPPYSEPPSHDDGSDGDDGSGSGVPRRPVPSAGSASVATTEPREDATIDHLVKGWIQRSYLKRDGWWAQLVLDEFDFLRGLGFSLTGSEMSGVHFHQKGHYVCFRRADRDVVIEYDPETETIGAVVIEHRGPRFIPLDDLIRSRILAAHVPPRSPVNRATIEDTVRWWAAGLRQIAAEVLGEIGQR